MDFLGFVFTPAGVLAFYVSALVVGTLAGLFAVALTANLPGRR